MTGQRGQKSILIAVASALLLMASLFLIVLLPRLLNPAPVIELPENGSGGIDIDTAYNPVLNDREQIESLAIGPENVQSVVAAMKRPEEYYLESASTLYAGKKSAETKIKRWTRRSLTRLVVVTPGMSGAANLIVGPDKVYSWEEGSTSYIVSERGLFDPDDLAWMPTYEDVLALDPASVTDGGTRQIDEGFCVYVQTGDPDSGYCDRYWILSDTGLLVRAETYEDGELAYRMAVRYSSQSSVDDGMFTLPTGDPIGD